MSPDPITEEQPAVERAYAAADAEIARLQEAVDRGITAGDGKAADKVAGNYRERLRHLLDTLDDHRLLLLGRVDLEADGDHDTVYVGRCRLNESGVEVASWEAPVAAALYDPERYDRAEIELLRRFQGDGRRRVLERIEQPIPVPEEGSIVSGTTGDALLERLRESSTGDMRDVVETIQAEQYRLMELPHDGVVVVQGGPGTGKTVVGLHRVSLMLFRNADTLSEGDVLVVGPNDVFIDYVRDVLPSLGRGQVRMSSLAGLAGVRASRHDTGLAREVKGQRSMERVIAAYLDQRISVPTDLRTSDGIEVPTEQLRTITDEARGSDQPYNTRRQQLRRRLHRLVTSLGSSISMESSDFENVLNRVMPDRAPRRVIADLLTGRRLLEAAADGILPPSERAAIQREEAPLEETVWTIEDAALLDEAAHQLGGLAEVGSTYQHVIVDEAQNLSPLQIRMLERRLVDGAGMTILGDLAQATTPWAPRYWDDHFAEGGIVVDQVVELELSYRVPAPVLDYANRLLAVIDVSTRAPTAIVKGGPWPLVERFSDEDLLGGLVRHLRDLDLRDEDRVGIVLRHDELQDAAESLREAGIDHALATRSLDHAVTLVTFDDVGGLEFDHVVVLNPGRTYRANGLTGSRELYVALSRARRSLALLHSDDLPPVLVDRDRPQPPAEIAAPAAQEPPPAPPEVDTVDEDQPDRILPPPPIPVETPGATASRPVGGTHWVTAIDGRVFVVDIEQPASVVVATTTGDIEMEVVARGALVRGETGLAWALQRSDGTPLALTTPTDPAAAIETLVQALGREG